MDLLSFVLTPKKEPYSSYSLPLFQKVWDPQELRDISFLKWTYRITFSALLAVTFVVDALFCHPYRQLISNHAIAKINRDIDLKNKAFLTKATGIAIAGIFVCGSYYFRSSESPKPPDIFNLDNILKSLPNPFSENTFLNDYYYYSIMLGAIATTAVGAATFFWPQKYAKNIRMEAERSQQYHCCVIAAFHAVAAMLKNELLPGNVDALLTKSEISYLDCHQSEAEKEGVKSPLGKERILRTQQSFRDHLTNSLPIIPESKCTLYYNNAPQLDFSLKQSEPSLIDIDFNVVQNPNFEQFWAASFAAKFPQKTARTLQGQVSFPLDEFWALLAAGFPPPQWKTTQFHIGNPNEAPVSQNPPQNSVPNDGKQEIFEKNLNNNVVQSASIDLQRNDALKFYETLLDTFLEKYPLFPNAKIKVEFSHNNHQHYKFWIIQKDNDHFQVKGCQTNELFFDEFWDCYQLVPNQNYDKQGLVNWLHFLAPNPDQSTQLKAWAIDYLDQDHRGPYTEVEKGFEFLRQNLRLKDIDFIFPSNDSIVLASHPPEENPFHHLPQDPCVLVLQQFCEPLRELNPGSQKGAVLQAEDYVYALTIKKEMDGTYSIQFFDSHGTNKIPSKKPNHSKTGAYMIEFKGKTAPSDFIGFLHFLQSNPDPNQTQLCPVNL